ncbi:MAG: hypothetical protein FD155_1608 [Bacteroidetes bacterium]|nr:MAG: hypothetical protein FD155_1608 [Bacteroidota bacterium]
MKKSIILTSLFFICMLGYLSAETVKEDKARVAAENWYQHYAPENKKSALVGSFSEFKYNGRTAFYIYNFDQGGFVLVSANDAVMPVLGYGFEHSAPEEITNESVKGWFDNYARQIDTVFVLKLKNEEMTSKWMEVLENRIPVKNGNSVGPLLTTTWDQGWPYNEMCPSDAGGPGGHVWIGCVATAMAQILKYHNYPSQGLGSYGYQWGSYPYTGADFGATTYNWSNMPNSISTSNLDIATIMYQTAVSCKSMWGAGSTGVGYSSDSDPMTRAFVNYFKTAFSTIHYVESQYYTTTEWNNLIQAELTNNRPVYYRGDGVGSHAWVCDGVDASNMYHFNWGWGGMYNGYFALSNINPGGFNFTSNQHAIIGIKPNDGSTLVTNTTWSGNVSKSTNVAVPDAITLTTSPGAVINFAQDCKLQIWGKLTSIGTSSNYVRFTAVDTTDGWLGIKWDNSHMDGTVMADNDTSKLIYTQVEYSDEHGIFCQYYGKILIDHCKINNNDAYNGAGISVWYQAININNTEIYNNHATNRGGGIYLSSDDNLSVTISQNDIHDNLADISGGGIYMICYETIVIKNNDIHHNQAVKGGGGVVSGLTGPKLINNKFCNNSTVGDGKGGGLYIESCSPHVVNNLFANNTRGGLYITTNSNPLLLNNTISNNSHPYYGGGIRIMYNSNPSLKNTILYGNTAPDGSQISLETTDCDPLFDHCDIQGGVGGFGGVGAGSNYTIANYTNNLELNPVYISPSGGAGNGYDGLSANWQLQSTSPCINAGDTTGVGNLLPVLDLGDNPRINGEIDMGVYEYCGPGQPSAIAGITILCQGAAQEYSVTNVSGVTYTWAVPPGASITSGQGSNTITVVFGAVSGNVSVVPSNLCGDGMTRVLGVTVSTLPAQPSIISGNSNPCEGATQSYSITAVTGESYNWTVPSDWSIVSGQGSSFIAVAVGANPGNITVTPSNNCGVGSSRTLAVTVNHAPNQASEISGNIAPCQGANATYSVTNVVGITHSWTVPTGWTIVSGQGSSSIAVTVGSNPGNITVTPNNACGSGSSSTLAVVVNTVPNQPSEIIGNVNPCEGYTGIYSVTNVVGVSYNWTIPTGAVFIDGQGTNSVVVNMGATGGNILVTPSNTCGNGLARSLAVVVNNPPSETPSQALGPETVNTYTTISSLYTTNAVADANYYLWDLFPTYAGVLSTGNDTSVTITWNTSFIGNCALMVKAVNNCGESQYSIPKIIYVDYITSLDEVKHNPITIFPNPSDGIFTVKSEYPMESMVLKDVTGKVVLHPIPDNGYSFNINLQGFAKGIYFLDIKHRYGKERVKLILIEN